MSKCSSSSLTASEPKVSPRLDLNTVLGCKPGHYPWDDWEKAALASGVPPDLAGLGPRLTQALGDEVAGQVASRTMIDRLAELLP